MRVGANLLWDGLSGQLIQSYGWETWRPLGKIHNVLKCLEKNLVDEVMITRPIRGSEASNEFAQDIEILKQIYCLTPLSISGGLRSKKEIEILSNSAFERIALSSAFILGNRSLIEYSVSVFGKQAIQCVLPCKKQCSRLSVFCSARQIYYDFESLDLELINDLSNEIILIDVENEGTENAFDFSLVEATKFNTEKLIISGGVGREVVKYAKKMNIAACYVDNRSLYREAILNEMKS